MTEAEVTTVKISREARKLLERLQVEAGRVLGSRPRLQDIMEAALRLAWRRRGELLEELGVWKPLEDPEGLLDELSVDLGVVNSGEEIDEVVYGWRGSRRQ